MMNPNYIVDNYKILSNSLKKQIELLPKLSSTSTKTKSCALLPAAMSTWMRLAN